MSTHEEVNETMNNYFFKILYNPFHLLFSNWTNDLAFAASISAF